MGGVTGQSLDDDISQVYSLHGHNLSVNTSDRLRTIDQNSLGVNDIDDGGQLASIRTVVDQHNTANLNKSRESLKNTHILATGTMNHIYITYHCSISLRISEGNYLKPVIEQIEVGNQTKVAA